MKITQIISSLAILPTLFSCQKDTTNSERQPSAGFTYTSTRNLPVTVSFYNLSTLPPGGANVTYVWSFGDGAHSTLPDSTTHFYVMPEPQHPHAIYKVELFQYVNAIPVDTAETILDLNITGPSGQSTHRLTTGQTAAFSYNIKNAFKVIFTNTSSGAANYTWLFSDGSTSSDSNPVKNFDAPGTYDVKLVAHNGEVSDTCKATLVFN